MTICVMLTLVCNITHDSVLLQPPLSFIMALQAPVATSLTIVPKLSPFELRFLILIYQIAM